MPSPQRILVVDDEEPIRALLQAAISGPDTHVLLAESGPQALSLAEDASPFELVVTDIMMAGMDGFELAEHLSHRGYASKFLFISGMCEEKNVDQRMAAFGSAAFLNKPFSIVELLQTIRRLLVAESRHENGIRPPQPRRLVR
jgi:CheY-like chemotaxis protein